MAIDNAGCRRLELAKLRHPVLAASLQALGSKR